jgi:chitin disaccharide deacetylase
VSDKVLIVNADDFGRSPGVNEGVIRCHTDGIVTSAGLMVRWPAAEEAAAYARRADLSLGLHLDLGEWEYSAGEWSARYEVLSEETPDVVEREIRGQLERFERLTGTTPTHLDSHQHVHRDEPARTALRKVGTELGVPVRHFTPAIRYSGAFYGQSAKGEAVPEAISVEGLIGVIERLPVGITELGCHPADPTDHESAYDRERAREVATLCDPRVRAAIDRNGVSLRSFADLAGPAVA